MKLDVVDLRDFYLTPTGQSVRRLLRACLRRFWPSVRGEVMLALGYTTPFLRPFYNEANTLISLMPAAQGVAYWPREGPNIAGLADFNRLPIANESVDRILVVHALEGAEDAENFFREIWRILKDHGRVVLVVARRRGLWADNDQTPFGTGQPYSTVQLQQALAAQGFSIEKKACALHAPPYRSAFFTSLAERWEKWGDRFFSAFGGVLVVEATKEAYVPLLVRSASNQRRFVFPMPDPSHPMPAAGRTEAS